jgi:hypothetical protein
MIVSKAKLVDGQLVQTDMKVIDQQSLTSDCWSVQFDGLTACETCEVKGTKECGGGKTLKKLKKNSNKK